MNLNRRQFLISAAGAAGLATGLRWPAPGPVSAPEYRRSGLTRLQFRGPDGDFWPAHGVNLRIVPDSPAGQRPAWHLHWDELRCWDDLRPLLQACSNLDNRYRAYVIDPDLRGLVLDRPILLSVGPWEAREVHQHVLWTVRNVCLGTTRLQGFPESRFV